MKGSDLVARLRSNLGARTDRELARRLGITTVSINNWKNRDSLTARQVANMISALERQIVRPEEVLTKVKRKLKVDSEQKLAREIGMTAPAFHHWRNGSVTAQRIANAIASARDAGALYAEVHAIRPIIEFFPLDASDSKHAAQKELFSIVTARGSKPHPYRQGLRDELQNHHGIYIFFDSRGRALYAGKAKQQSLWKEMLNAFNRGRKDQKIKRVSHPESKVPYKNSHEQSRQIKDATLVLHELASYVSAYEVSQGLIGELESLLVRAFPNDLLNVRMERFDQQRGGRK